MKLVRERISYHIFHQPLILPHEIRISDIPLIQNLSQLYNQHKYEAVTIVIGAMGAVPKSLNQNIEKLSKYINKEQRKTLIPRIQKAALLGTVKILKTVLKM